MLIDVGPTSQAAGPSAAFAKPAFYVTKKRLCRLIELGLI
jgi:hypothetical protein